MATTKAAGILAAVVLALGATGIVIYGLWPTAGPSPRIVASTTQTSAVPARPPAATQTSAAPARPPTATQPTSMPVAMTRERANRVKCANNLRQIALGAVLYANDHQGNLPDDLETEMKEQAMAMATFLCPSGNVAVPAQLRGAAADQQAYDQQVQWVAEHGSYVYCGKGLTNNAPADFILAFEKFDNHGGDGCNVLFADAHVEFLTVDGFKKTVAAVRQHGQQLPETVDK